jgi:hypothetical protein
MRDAAIEYFGGPKDGEAVQWPPNRVSLRQDTVEDSNAPHFIRVPSGSYKFNPVTKRYEWIG